MKRSLKYSVLFVLAVLFCSFVMNRVDDIRTTTNTYSESDIFSSCHQSFGGGSQVIPISCSINHDVSYLKTVGLQEIDNYGNSQIIEDKGSLVAAPYCIDSFQIKKHVVSSVIISPFRFKFGDPVAYYIFGLRKIIV